MNKKLLTMCLISGTAISTGIGIVFPELLLGISSIIMGGTSLGFSLRVMKESARRKIDNLILEDLR